MNHPAATSSAMNRAGHQSASADFGYQRGNSFPRAWREAKIIFERIESAKADFAFCCGEFIRLSNFATDRRKTVDNEYNF